MTPELGKETSRGRILSGATYEYEVGCGKIYITINRNKSGDIREVFLKMAKSGHCTNIQSEGLGRVISLYMRSGGNPEKIIKHLDGTQCPEHKGDAKSCTSAVAEAFKDALKETK